VSHYLAAYVRLLGWVAMPLAGGLLLRRCGAPRGTSRVLFLAALFGFQTPIVLLAVWVATVAEGAEYLPLFTLAGWLAAAGAARWASGWMGHAPRQRGAFIASMALSNHGYTLLGLIALVLFGERGIAQATYAQVPIMLFIAFVCFPIGRFYGEGGGGMTLGGLARRTFTDPKSLPVLSVLAGLALNLAGVPRPAWCAVVLRGLVYGGTVVTGLAVGMLLGGLSVRRYLRENLFSFAYRSSAYPLLFFGMARAAGLDHVNTSILVLFGLVPSALFSSMVADLFGLDTDLTASVFLVSTLLFLAITLPVYVLIVTA